MEANKEKYFIDGFLIKHFNIFPLEFNKNNLFYEQKIFLVYLLGTIPSIENWTEQVNYLNQKDGIEKLQLKDIEVSKEDLSIATLHGRDIKIIKEERLENEKRKKFKELNKKFGIEEDRDEIEISHDFTDERKTLWEMLQGKGLINKKE